MLYECFLVNLNAFLTGSEDYNNNIIRKHTKNLAKIGEFSVSRDTLTIYKRDDFDECSVVSTSKEWPLRLAKCVKVERSFSLFVERPFAFKAGLGQVLLDKSDYGAHSLSVNLCLETDVDEGGKLSLTELRVCLTKDVCANVVSFRTIQNTSEASKTICFTPKSKQAANSVLCGSVLSTTGTKNCVSAEEYYSKRTIDMRLMAQHKYGLRLTANSGWSEFFEKLGQAAVVFDLLENKVSKTVTINLNDSTCSSSKGASFVLYNCARLAQLFKKFDKRTASGVYPELIPFEGVNFELLKEPEEWELLFLFVLQFPLVVKSSIRDIVDCKLSLHIICDFLSRMCAVISIYYRRVRILTEPREHLYDLLHSRIYLLKVVEQVLHNGLKLLNIDPVKQM